MFRSTQRTVKVLKYFFKIELAVAYSMLSKKMYKYSVRNKFENPKELYKLLNII